jgi:hypothetical protein
MLSYDALDTIADSINPVMGLIALVLPWARRGSTARHALALDAMTLAAVSTAYVWQSLDSFLALWPRAGLDFSTHAAVFVAIASSIWQYGTTWRWVVGTIGIGYGGLMRVQDYHSLLDITTTVASMLPGLVLFWWIARRLLPSEPPPQLSQPSPSGYGDIRSE